MTCTVKQAARAECAARVDPANRVVTGSAAVASVIMVAVPDATFRFIPFTGISTLTTLHRA
jgi:hypothetical protein